MVNPWNAHSALYTPTPPPNVITGFACLYLKQINDILEDAHYKKPVSLIK